MQVGVVGINHKLAKLKLRELLAKACEHRFGIENHFQLDDSFLLLSTCNRTEIYFSSDNLSETHTYILGVLRDEVGEEFDQKLYSFFGLDCFSHLCRVTAGLDSAIVAETEIQGQVKAAYENSRISIQLPSSLHFLFQKALRVGKWIRTEMQMGRGMPGLEHAVSHVIDHFFKDPEKAKHLFVGASSTNRKIIHCLSNRGFQDLSICNRTMERSEAIASETNIKVVAWNNLDSWTEYDSIILGTKSPYPLISLKENPGLTRISHKILDEDGQDVTSDLPTMGRELCPRDKARPIGGKDGVTDCSDSPRICEKSGLNRSKLIIDLSVPRNADPLLAKQPYVTLLNIDHLNRSLSVRRKKLTALLEKAEQLVQLATLKYGNIFQEKERRKVAV